MKIDIAKQISESKVGDEFVMSNREVWAVTHCESNGNDAHRKLCGSADHWWFYASENGQSNIHICGRPTIICRYVEPTPVLGFELKAGESYETQKPDGTPGPVVEPSLSLNGKAWRRYAPFYLDGGLLYVLTTGDCVNMLTGETHYRITAPYIEPKPPTLTERLEHYAELDRGDMRREQLLAGIIADVKALEATK